MQSVADVAREFTALLRAGQYEAAAKRYWANDIISIEPVEQSGGTPSVVSGLAAALRKNQCWFGASRIDDLSVDGPFVTGNQFALFLDMMIVNRTSGESRPFTEIALYTVRDAKITEERYFYD
jgi:hypothetical protein